MHNVNLNIEYR